MKKKVFYLSLIPYFIVLIIAIYYGIVGYNYNVGTTTIYGFDAFIDFLIHRCWIEIIFNPIWCTLLVLLFGYQLYYFIDSKNSKKLKEKEHKKWNIKKIIYIISISVWCLYFGFAIWCIPFGFTHSWFFNTTTEYGMEGFLSALFWNGITLSIIPILPITLIYIIIYTVKLKNKK